jgi:transposase InsO family protein
MSGQHKVAWLCEALLVSRSGYYDWKKRRRQPGPRQVENARLRERIREEFARSRQTYGSPRLARALGCPGRRNRIARLMRRERIFARQRSKYRVATTDSRHPGLIAPNRVRSLTVQRPDQVWATDATCVLTGQGWLYLVAVLDVFTRRVIGWAMHQILDAQLVIAALRMALAQRCRGRATDNPPKRSIEVRHGLKSAGEGSFADSRVRIEQKRLRFLHSDSREVVDKIHSSRLLEHLAKVMPADISRARYPPERQRFRLLLLDEVPRADHVGGLVFFTAHDQLIRQDRKVLRKNTQEPQHRAIPVRR